MSIKFVLSTWKGTIVYLVESQLLSRGNTRLWCEVFLNWVLEGAQTTAHLHVQVLLSQGIEGGAQNLLNCIQKYID